MRLGIDVGGTNTDAVLMDGEELQAKIKRPTTPDVTDGIVAAIAGVLATASVPTHALTSVMIGTTHFTNALVERRDLARTAIVRLGLPATRAVEPFDDWPDELRTALGGHGVLVHGGNEFDGRELSALDEQELISAVRRLRQAGVESIAVAAVFSPVSNGMETRAAEIIAREAPAVSVTLSHHIGRLGLLERENAAAINAALRPLAANTIQAFRQSLARLEIDAPLYITQNDGTLMHSETAEQYPVRTFASGPTNSIRGAAFLSGLQEALVLDIGGSTSDVGALTRGFPRETAVTATIGGVRTNFRMPDIISIGLGGGSIVREDGIGPRSVGLAIRERARIFGGDTLTATDLAVAGGHASLGNPEHVADLEQARVQKGLQQIERLIEDTLDRIKLQRGDQPLIVVGGGSILIGNRLTGISQILRPADFDVANAVGAAIAQISGEVDKIYPLTGSTRTEAVQDAQRRAIQEAVKAGARSDSVHIVDVEEVPVAYMENAMVRVRAKAVGELSPLTKSRLN